MHLTNPVHIFTVVLLVVLIAPLLFSRLKIPGIAGLILAGMLVGPRGFGLLARDETFHLLEKVGLLYLMFLAGLDISPREFRRRLRYTVTFGSLTFLFPQVVGTVLALHLGLNWTAAILMASMFASHTLIPYPIIQRLGLGKHRAVSTTVGGTILTNTTAMLILAVVAESARAGAEGVNWPLQLAWLGLYFIFGIVALPRFAAWFYREIEPDGITEFVFILATAFLMSSFAQLAGVEAIVGAFLAGIALSPLVPEQSIATHRLQFTGHALFIPFFLLSTGMLIDPSVFFSDLRTVQMCLFMTGTGLLTKWLAAEVSGRLLKFSSEERKVVFGLSVNQAAATLAAVMIGFNLNIFDAAIFNGAIAMILLTCIVGPMVTGRYAPSLAQRLANTEVDISGREQGPLLVAVGDERGVDSLLDLAVLVRDRGSVEPLHVLSVADESGGAAGSVGRSESMLGQIVARLASGAIMAMPQIRMDANPARGILRAVRELRIDTLVLGSSRSTVRYLRSQSLADQVLQTAPCMALVASARRPLNTATRLVFIVPPLLETHPGFRRVVMTVVRLCEQLETSLTLAGEPATLERARERANSEAFARAQTVVEASFNALTARLGGEIQRNDLVVLVNNRTGALGWHPRLDRLPRDLARRAAPSGIVVIVPPAPSDYDDVAERTDSAAPPVSPNLLTPAFFDLDRCPASVHEAVERVLGAHGPKVGPQTLERWVQALSETEPVELESGTVLIHAHVREIEAPDVVVARFATPTLWEAAPNPIGRVILLISPVDYPPDKHLETLASIVRWVQSWQDGQDGASLA